MSNTLATDIEVTSEAIEPSLAIDLVIEKVGERQILPENEWAEIITIDASRIRNAKKDGKLAEISMPRWGFMASDLRAWIVSNNIDHELTPVGKSLLAARAV